MRFTLRSKVAGSIISAALIAALVGPLGVRASAVSQPLAAPLRVATFGKPALYKIASTGTAFDIASGDFTGTRVKDIVVADGAAGSVSLLAGRGDGTFAAPVTVYARSGQSITAIATGDFNGDGHLDFALVSEGGSTQDVVLLGGDGHRHFVESARAPLRFLDQMGPLPFGGIRSIGVGRFSRSGAVDVAVTDGVNYISVFTGDGHGGLSVRRDLLAAALPESLIVANLYGRDLADLGIVDNDSTSVYTFANRGDGTFDRRMRAPLETLPVNAQPVSLTAGDFRRLGRTDLFAVYSATGLPTCCGVGRILLSDGHGSYAKGVDVRVAANVSFPAAGATADFNGDGILDLAVVAESFPRQNDVIVLPGNGDGTFSTSAQTQVTITSGNQKILLADKMIVEDFNGDGKPDIAVALDRTNGMGVVVLLNTTKNAVQAVRGEDR